MAALELEVLPGDDPGFHELAAMEGSRFEAWLAAWEALPLDHRDPFSHPVWVAAWLGAFPPADDPARHLAVVVRDAGRVVGLLPLRIESRRGLRRHEWLAHVFSPQVGGASPALPPGSHRDVLERLLARPLPSGRRPRMVWFRKVDAGNPVLASGPGVHVEPADARAVLRADGGWEARLAGLSKNFKGQLRKSINKLKKLEDVAITAHDGPPGIEAAFAEFLDVEESGWKGGRGEKASDKGERGLATRRDPRVLAYYEAVVRHLPRHAPTVVHVLRAEGRPVAASFCFAHGDLLYMTKIAYVEDYARLSPGHLLVAHCLERFCPDHGLAGLNFVGRPAPWHERWKPATEATFSVAVTRTGAAGGLARLATMDAREKGLRAARWLGLRPPPRTEAPESREAAAPGEAARPGGRET